MAKFEVVFTNLSRFTPELVAIEGRRCLEFEKRLRTGLLFKVVESIIRDYGRLIEATAHLETVIQTGEERMRGSLRGRLGIVKGRGVPPHSSPREYSLDPLFLYQVLGLGEVFRVGSLALTIVSWATSL